MFDRPYRISARVTKTGSIYRNQGSKSDFVSNHKIGGGGGGFASFPKPKPVPRNSGNRVFRPKIGIDKFNRLGRKFFSSILKQGGDSVSILHRLEKKSDRKV